MGGTKRKATPSIPEATPPTRGRTSRSKKKQGEANINKVLTKNAKKVALKGKKKAGKSSGVVYIGEMDLVLKDEDKDVVVPTPSVKKEKDFSKEVSRNQG